MISAMKKAMLGSRFKLQGPIRCVSFDALGTLFVFKEPVAVQYLKIARKCGVSDSLDHDSVLKAFGTAYKQTSAEHPNYGKKSSNLAGPDEWWDLLVNRTFAQIIPKKSIPADIGSAMYHHFSSGAAYNLRPEVMYLFQELRRLRSASEVVSLTTCVITNSDPRVADILRDLGLKVGHSIAADAQPDADARPPGVDLDNDIDFVCSSYEAGSEKPDPAIYEYAKRCMINLRDADEVYPSKQYSDAQSDPPSTRQPEQDPPGFKSHQRESWLHVGDEFVKDCVGAAAAGFTPVLLCEEQAIEQWHDKLAEQHGFAIASLKDVAQFL